MQANRHIVQAEQEMALLYRKHAPGLLAYVRMHIASAEDAEDLLVEVFMAALENAKFAALSEKEKQLWLWRVTRNKVIDTYRRAKTRQNVTLEQVADGLFEDEMAAPNMRLCGKKIIWICMHTCKGCPCFNSRFYACALDRICPVARSRPGWASRKTSCASHFHAR